MHRRHTNSSIHAALLLFACVALIVPHTVASYPPAGRDEFKSSAEVEVDLTDSGGPRLSLTLVGPTRIERSDAFDPGDGRKMVLTEIIGMDLRGDSPLGAIEIRERGQRQSIGIIRQKEAGVDFPADSFFDVFVELATPTGVFHNQEPIRLTAMIDAIPPLQAQYVPDAVFEGVDLFDQNGVKVGVIRHAVHFVGQRPSFSVAPQGPSMLDPVDIFDVPRRDRRIPGTTGLGLQAGDDVDGLSYGIAFIAQLLELRFSVDPTSMGIEGSAVRREADKMEAHGDEFWTSLANLGTNAQELDENGDTASPFPLRISDDVDALTEPPIPFVDPNLDEVPENRVYFSLSAQSPSATPMGFSAADILVSVGGGPPDVFISSSALRLDSSDDVDAFCLVAQTRTVLFSLAPGSPSLAGGLSAADLFLVVNAQDPQGPPATLSPFAPASSLGLRPEDNLNALKCTVVEVDYMYHSVLQGRFSDEEELFNLWGPSKTLVAVGPNGEARQGSNQEQPYDFVFQELAILSMSGTDNSGNPVSATLRPGESRNGFIREMPSEDNVPNRLDIKPWGNGEAVSVLEFVLNVQRGDRILHTQTPLNLGGIITEKPPARFEVLVQSASRMTQLARGPISWRDSSSENAALSAASDPANQAQGIELVDEDDQPSGIQLSDVAFFPNAPPPAPRISPAGIVSAASFQQGAAPETIMSLFGENLADSTEAATETPLPTELAGTTVMVTDSQGNQAAAALLPNGAEQAAGLAPLFFVSAGQINFLMPAGLAPGLATVTVTDGDGNESSSVVLIQNVAPALFSADASGSGVAAAFFLCVAADGTRTQDLLFDPGTLDAVPLDLTPEGDQVFLLLFGTGVRGFTSEVTATVGGRDVPVLGAVEQPQFVGLDQVNIGPLPAGLAGSGEVEIVITVDGKQSNAVTVAIQ